MPRTPANASADELPEILRSPSLAAILTPLLVEAVDKIEKEFATTGLGRVMAEPCRTLRNVAHEVRTFHGLDPLEPSSVGLDNPGPATAAAPPAAE